MIPDLRRALSETHQAVARLNEISTAMSTLDGCKAFQMESGMPFMYWLSAHSSADKHSLESVQWHQWESWHATTAANRAVVTRKQGTWGRDDVGEVTLVHAVPQPFHLWDDGMNTFLKPYNEAFQAYRDMIPEELRPVRVQEEWDVRGTGCNYVGMNVTPSAELGLEQFCFPGTCKPDTHEHHGIHVHRDKNNKRGKMGFIGVLGCFKGFFQFMVPYGISIACPSMGLLCGDTSDMLHSVLPGSGVRISLVVCNHQYVEDGVREWDRKPVAGFRA